MKIYFTILKGGQQRTVIRESEAAKIITNATTEYKRPYDSNKEEKYLYEADINNEDDNDDYSVALAVKINGKWQRFAEESNNIAEFLSNYESVKSAAAALGRLGGKSKSAAKAKASAENGKKGGRPRKELKENGGK